MAVAAEHPDAPDDEQRPRPTFGDEIKALREAKGLSQQAIAEQVGISAAMLSHLESGRRRASEKVLPDLERALGVDPGELRRIQAVNEAARLIDPKAGNGAFLEQTLTYLLGQRTELDGHLDQIEDDLEAVASGIGSLYWTQIKNALAKNKDSGKPPDDRIDAIAEIVTQLRDMSPAELMKVSGFVAGLKAAKKPADYHWVPFDENGPRMDIAAAKYHP